MVELIRGSVTGNLHDAVLATLHFHMPLHISCTFTLMIHTGKGLALPSSDIDHKTHDLRITQPRTNCGCAVTNAAGGEGDMVTYLVAHALFSRSPEPGAALTVEKAALLMMS
jgi:hypothetical protein